MVVSTSRMFAPGAIACAYSTSSDVSSAHPAIIGRLTGSKAGTGPLGCRIVKRGGAGKPKALSNVASSPPMPLKSYESTMTIVYPAPLSPLA